MIGVDWELIVDAELTVTMTMGLTVTLTLMVMMTTINPGSLERPSNFHAVQLTGGSM